jgi:hypothetical protein
MKFLKTMLVEILRRCIWLMEQHWILYAWEMFALEFTITQYGSCRKLGMF